MRSAPHQFIFAALGCAALGAAVPTSGALAQQAGLSGNIAAYMAGVAPTPVAIAEVPAAARAAAEQALGTPDLANVTEQQHHSDHVYQFRSVDAAGARHSAIVTDDGTLVHQY
jgi:hypothetical protein